MSFRIEKDNGGQVRAYYNASKRRWVAGNAADLESYTLYHNRQSAARDIMNHDLVKAVVVRDGRIYPPTKGSDA